MSEHKTNLENEGAVRGTTTSYVSGFILSLILTLTAYFVVVQQNDSAQPKFSYQYIVTFILILALVQLFVQLLFFLHLDRESRPRWNLMVASFALTVVLILVLGSLWIMHNLDYHHMESPAATDKAIIQDEGVHY